MCVWGALGGVYGAVLSELDNTMCIGVGWVEYECEEINSVTLKEKKSLILSTLTHMYSLRRCTVTTLSGRVGSQTKQQGDRFRLFSVTLLY